MVERMKKKGRRMIAWVLAGCMSLGLVFVSPATAPAATQMVPVQVTYGQSEARAMLDRINSFRTDADQAWAYDGNNRRVSYSGLGNLQYDYELEQVAMKRAAEIALSYGHTRPNGKKCFTAYTFSHGGAGENIAAGFSSEERVFNAWKEDNENYSGQGHRRNMLGKNYTAVGIGHVKYDGMDYWVQEFSSNGSGMSQTEANDSVSVVEIETSDSYIQDMKATKTSLSVKKGETKELSDLQIMLLIYDHFGNNDYCCTKADYTASVADTSIAICDHNRLTGVKAGKTTLTLSAYGKNCEIEVTVTDSEGSTEDPKPDDGTGSSSESVKLKITYPSKKIAAGQKVTLAITEDVIWKSSNSNYATVNEKGVVTTKKAGAGKTVTITAVSKEDNHVTDSITICIKKNAVTKIKVKNPPKTVTAGKSVTIKPSVVTNGKDVNKTLKWTTSNSKYASVNANGKVVAKKAGKGKTVTITAQSTDGTNKKVKIRIKIK